MKKYENPSSFPEVIDPLIFFQDIDIPHQETFERFKSLITQGKYTEATEYINSVNDIDGYFADLYNLIVKRVYNLQYQLKLANTKFIYSTVTPDKNYLYLHNGVIWFNYDKSTKTVAPDSHDIQVNEIIADNMEIRRVDSIEPDGGKYNIEATIPHNKLCYEDIQLDVLVSLKEDFEDTVEMSPTWYTNRTYYRGEQIVEEIVCDGQPERNIKTRSGLNIRTRQGTPIRTKTYDDFEYVIPSYHLATKDNPQKEVITRDGKYIKLWPYEDTIGIIYIFGTQGKLLRTIRFETRPPVVKTDPDPLPVENKDFIHTKFRIMTNLPTMLWHRLSFVTDYRDTIVPGSTNIKDILDRYATRVETNVPRLLAPAESIGVPRSSVDTVTDLVDTYNQQIVTLTNTIKSITGMGEHLNGASLPREIALFILYQMYSPIIDAVFRLAARKGMTVSDTYTIRNAIHILKQLVVIPLYIKDSDGTLKQLKTRDNKTIKLKYGSEE